MSGYQRILLKLSGEAFSLTKDSTQAHLSSYQTIAKNLLPLTLKTQLGIVLGGGNFFRGQQGYLLGLSKPRCDQIGMIGTLINSLLLQQAFIQQGVKAIVLSAITSDFCERFDIQKAQEYLSKGTTLIFAGGTGLPYFTTDSAAALRACEIQAQVLVKATKVDGVYDKDPNKFPDAKKFSKLTFAEALDLNLQVLDQTAFALCKENNIPIRVIDLFQEDLVSAIMNPNYGTLIS